MVRLASLVCVLLAFAQPAVTFAEPLPNTKPLTTKDDLAKQMVDGIHKYLDRRIAESVKDRQQYWKMDFSSNEAFEKSVEPNRQRLRKILGIVEERLPPAMEYVSSTDRPALVAETEKIRIYTVRWPVFGNVMGEGYLLEPKEKPKAQVVAIPDADADGGPEYIVGLLKNTEGAFARRLAEAGCRVVVPTLVDRSDVHSGSDRLKRFTNQTHREFVYRMAFEMGRHIIGYELQKVMAAVDGFAKNKDHGPVGVIGFGEGGLLAMYAGAVDTRIQVTYVSGYAGPREKLHDEPIYRNVQGLLKEFGDGELLRLIRPRKLIVEPTPFQTPPAPAVRPGRGGAGPGSYQAPDYQTTVLELTRTLDDREEKTAYRGKGVFVPGPAGDKPANSRFAPPGRETPLAIFASDLDVPKAKFELAALTPSKLEDAADRNRRQFEQLVQHTQLLQAPAAAERQKLMNAHLKFDSLDNYVKSQEKYRKLFHEEVEGALPKPTMPMNPRTRLVHTTDKWKGYEVVLDLYEEVICYGILLVPNDIKAGEKRPVVVCQHGLEGRPSDIVDPTKKTPYYNSFGAQLANRGFIVFAPQNPYIFQNHFRQFVRKANGLGLTIYSFIIAQHERILDWLETLPYVDASRIAFYGLSYGGKVAMRIPAVVTRYCLSICSGDFNEWIWKNINLDWVGSYMFTGEYEMYEFNLGTTFNYSEMAALIAPRPFMVERGHSDGVGLDEYVAFEYAKVRRLYAQLGIADRTEIEFFVGGHVIHGQGTFDFLHRHLRWPKK